MRSLSPDTVSYTHLDVYKRQVLSTTFCKSIREFNKFEAIVYRQM